MFVSELFSNFQVGFLHNQIKSIDKTLTLQSYLGRMFEISSWNIQRSALWVVLKIKNTLMSLLLDDLMEQKFSFRKVQWIYSIIHLIHFQWVNEYVNQMLICYFFNIESAMIHTIMPIAKRSFIFIQNDACQW